MTLDQKGLLSPGDRRGLALLGLFQRLHLLNPRSEGHGLGALLKKLLV